MNGREVEERLVEAARVFADPREVRRWAGDAPWALSRARQTAAEWWDEQVGLLEAGELRRDLPEVRLPPTREMIARAGEAMLWLPLIDERDRRMVALAVAMLGQGASRVPWRRLARIIGGDPDPDTLRLRYLSALNALAATLRRRALLGKNTAIRSHSILESADLLGVEAVKI